MTDATGSEGQRRRCPKGPPPSLRPVEEHFSAEASARYTPPPPPGVSPMRRQLVTGNGDSDGLKSPMTRPSPASLMRLSPNGGDCAAGTSQRITLASDSWMSKFCLKVPGMLTFTSSAVVAITACAYQDAFHYITATLMIYISFWTAQLAFGCTRGAWRMQETCKVDWHAKLLDLYEDCPYEAEAAHIVLLPNYKEDEAMLKQTLENIGKSPMARDHIWVVLGMEGREGVEGQQKAERLIAATKHLFAGIVASTHPKGLPGEIAGKSSNSQWAFRDAMRVFAPLLAKMDPSRVFISVGDADTLWHPQFFSALTYQGLTMSDQERAWTIWQPPVLLLRNLWSVPGCTRVSGYATFMFEMAGLANLKFGAHLCYSSYSTTLALLSHPNVGGWDADVIAEDHHMFCKCFFASIWESVAKVACDDTATISSKVQLQPIFLPALGYMVESSDGWWASNVARFQQARRHTQGVAEISYVLLQYMQLIARVGFFNIPFRTHCQILDIEWKMTTVHIINAVQAITLVMTALMVSYKLLVCALAGEGAMFLDEVINANPHGLMAMALGKGTVDGGSWVAVCISLGCVPFLGIMTTFTMYTVVKDLMEGKYYTKNSATVESSDNFIDAATKSKDADGSEAIVQYPTMTSNQKLKLLNAISFDMYSLGEPSIVIFCLIPELMAAWSLMWNGHRFEYIVAAKPTEK
eukprot:TRINITY_DN90626_c0_g1_i1.p1 TRINITY_DN90626_c0_g1~~TRINITY_DN90626_c0_g1_i1.p1  ORF type:complete len:694 (-),score=133.86 TRINITY_DN90626_c0_g1_i1:388-2469(-)